MAVIFALILTLLSPFTFADKLELYYDDGNTLEKVVKEHTGKKAPEQALPDETVKQRQPANAFRNGTYQLKKNCIVYSSPETSAKKLGRIRIGKKIRVDGHNDIWRKIYLKKGDGYLQGDCL